MVNIKAHGVPYLRCQLPFVDQARGLAVKQSLDLGLRQKKVLLLCVGIVQIKDALGDLLGGRRLSTPFWTINQNGTLAFESICQQSVEYSPFILLHG